MYFGDPTHASASPALPIEPPDTTGPMRTRPAPMTPAPSAPPASLSPDVASPDTDLLLKPSLAAAPSILPAPTRALPDAAVASDRILAWADRNRARIFIALALIYFAGFNAQWRLEPDSALYLSVGRNIAEGHGYTFHGHPNRLAYPGLPILFAGTFRLFHTTSLLPALILMPLLGAATLAMTYRLIFLRAGRPTAVLVTFGVAMSRLFYRYNFELLSDLPFLLGVTTFLVGYEAIFYRSERAAAGRDGRIRWFDWAFLACGLVIAVAMRPAMWALVLAVIATLGWSLGTALLSRRKFHWGHGLICLGVLAAVVIFYDRDPRHAATTNGPGYREEDEMLSLRPQRLWTMTVQLADSAPAVFESALVKATFGMPLGIGFSSVMAGVMIALGAGLAWHRPLWGLFFLTTLAMVMLVRPLDRYFLPLVPLLVFAWWRAITWVNRTLPGRWGNRAFLLLFALGAIPNGARVGGFVVEQRQVPFLHNYKEGRYASADSAARIIAEHVPDGREATTEQTGWVLVPPKCGRILTFLSRRYAIEPSRNPTSIPTASLHSSWSLPTPSCATPPTTAPPFPSGSPNTP